MLSDNKLSRLKTTQTALSVVVIVLVGALFGVSLMFSDRTIDAFVGILLGLGLMASVGYQWSRFSARLKNSANGLKVVNIWLAGTAGLVAAIMLWFVIIFIQSSVLTMFTAIWLTPVAAMLLVTGYSEYYKRDW